MIDYNPPLESLPLAVGVVGPGASRLVPGPSLPPAGAAGIGDLPGRAYLSLS